MLLKQAEIFSAWFNDAKEILPKIFPFFLNALNEIPYKKSAL
jgi:hypothetical protein